VGPEKFPSNSLNFDESIQEANKADDAPLQVPYYLEHPRKQGG